MTRDDAGNRIGRRLMRERERIVMRERGGERGEKGVEMDIEEKGETGGDSWERV